MPAKSRRADEVTLNASAMELLTRAVELLASGQQVTPDLFRSAGIPVSSGKTMLEAQKFRANWYGLPRKVLGPIARLASHRNWFAAPVHRLNLDYYGNGFAFDSQEARDWAAFYPFGRAHDDLLDEYLVSSAAVAFWRTDPDPGTLPVIEVPDCEAVEYEVIGGIPQITVQVARRAKLTEEHRAAMGAKMWTAVTTGKPLVIRQGKETEDGFAFAILKTGKTTQPLPPPALTSILDDLDFIEAVRVGDWNGAYARREIIRHTKKGAGVTSGPNAGTARGNAKYAEIKAIIKAMSRIVGKTDLATNYDQTVDWMTFPADFFNGEMMEGAHRRLIFWGGFAAGLLLKTDSQMSGLSALLYDRLRAQVESFRARFGVFLADIFNAPSFRVHFPDAPRLVPQWSVKHLYSAEALLKLGAFASTHAVLAPQSLRELFGADDARESKLMREAQSRREDFTPPYEPRQGLLPGLFPEDFHKLPQQSTKP